MTSGALDLLGNPVRMRIVHALYDGREVTTAQLCARLADVSQATLYRHVAAMEKAGLLEVVAEQRVRGAVERTYRLRRSATRLTDVELGNLSAEDYRRAMHTVASVMVAEFERTLEASGAPAGARTSLRQLAIWLTNSELAELRKAVVEFISRNRDNSEEGRRRFLLTPAWFCMEPESGEDGSTPEGR